MPRKSNFSVGSVSMRAASQRSLAKQSRRTVFRINVNNSFLGRMRRRFETSCKKRRRNRRKLMQSEKGGRRHSARLPVKEKYSQRALGNGAASASDPPSRASSETLHRSLRYMSAIANAPQTMSATEYRSDRAKSCSSSQIRTGGRKSLQTPCLLDRRRR